MSFIRNPQRDYLAAVVANTRRDDTKLIAEHGPYQCSEADSGRLLWALLARWPHDQFDELNVAIDAPHSPQLMAALSFMQPRVRRRHRMRMLSKENQGDVWRWLITVAGRDINGLRLERNLIGWCEVAIAGRVQ